MQKVCTKCGLSKPFDMFNKNSQSKDGLQYHCKPCKLNYQRNSPNRSKITAKYREANKQACSARSVASRQKRPDYYNAKMREWSAANRDHLLERRRQWYKQNAALDIERVRRRAGRIRSAEDWMTAAERAEVQGLYDFCALFKGFEVDHIIPLNGQAVSGLHVPWNLQVLPIAANRSKGNKFQPGDARA